MFSDLEGRGIFPRYPFTYSQVKELPTLKDMDFLNKNQKVYIGEEEKKVFLEKLKRDVEVMIGVLGEVALFRLLPCGLLSLHSQYALRNFFPSLYYLGSLHVGELGMRHGNPLAVTRGEGGWIS